MRDALLGKELGLEVNATTTCGDLKWLVQSVQASSGGRVIPTHFQVLPTPTQFQVLPYILRV